MAASKAPKGYVIVGKNVLRLLRADLKKPRATAKSLGRMREITRALAASDDEFPVKLVTQDEFDRAVSDAMKGKKNGGPRTYYRIVK